MDQLLDAPRNLSPHLTDIQDLEEMRRIYNAALPTDLPPEILCRDCKQPKQLIRVNDRIAFWAHFDPDVHAKCVVRLTYRTSFIQNVARMWGHWATSHRLMQEDDYASHWEFAFHQHADTFLRNTFELTKVDRQWLYTHLEGPVLDVGCGNCIDYPHFKDRGYMGVDVTPSFLDAAVTLHDVPDTCVTLADARHLPFPDQSYRSGYLKDVLLHYKQVDGYAFIDELLRVCENAYIVWGHLGDRSFLPSHTPVEERWGDTFYYNIYDLAQLEQRYQVTFIGDDTTITKVAHK
jgi:SAM-dependent methyltransferase